MPLGQLWPTGPIYSLYTAYIQPIYSLHTHEAEVCQFAGTCLASCTCLASNYLSLYRKNTRSQSSNARSAIVLKEEQLLFKEATVQAHSKLLGEKNE